MERRATRNAQLFTTLNLSPIHYRGLLRRPREFVYVRYNIIALLAQHCVDVWVQGNAIAGGGETRCRAITIGEGLRLKEKYPCLRSPYDLK